MILYDFLFPWDTKYDVTQKSIFLNHKTRTFIFQVRHMCVDPHESVNGYNKPVHIDSPLY